MKLLDRLPVLPPLFRNFYFVTTLLFLTWMFFFDSNDFIRQFQMSRKLTDIEHEKEYYEQKIVEVQKDREELMSNPELLEKFAREKYLMRKPTETVFVLVDKVEEKE